MLRVLVVDDEAIVLESVTQVLSTQFENIAIETARNSREGLIKVEHFRPNIVMTDIKMPGMNGIEFIERIRKVNQIVKIVIVSAYDHFEYAKEAVRFNVDDYILKPLSKSKLIDVITGLEEKIKSEEDRRNTELDHIEKYYQSIQLVESNFINSILLNRNIQKYMPYYRELLEIPFQNGAMVTIEFDKLGDVSESGEMSTYHQKIYDCADFLKTHIKYNRTALVSNPFLNRIYIYVEGDNDRNYWNNLSIQLMERFKLRVRIGLGTVKPINAIKESYSESLLALRVSDDLVAFIKDIKEVEASFERFDQLLGELHDAFTQRNKSFHTVLKHFEGEYIKMLSQKNTLEYAEASLAESMVVLYDKCRRLVTIYRKEEGRRHFLTELFSHSAPAKLQVYEKRVSDWFTIYTKMQNESFNGITLHAVEILKRDYHQEISLEEVALKLSVTPQYLSKIFKEDTGVTFKEYLTEQRIEASKQLLKNSEMNIKDICFKVGYNDTSYFIRAFKKYEGLTPKDYQRVYR